MKITLQSTVLLRKNSIFNQITSKLLYLDIWTESSSNPTFCECLALTRTFLFCSHWYNNTESWQLGSLTRSQYLNVTIHLDDSLNTSQRFDLITIGYLLTDGDENNKSNRFSRLTPPVVSAHFVHKSSRIF